MRRFVYNARSIFSSIEERLRNGERIVIYECEFPRIERISSITVNAAI